MRPLPFKQTLKGDILIREFSKDVKSDELSWHRDREDREVYVKSGKGWQLQIENKVPFTLCEGETYYIPKNTYHRIIKGATRLVVEINELTEKKRVARKKGQHKNSSSHSDLFTDENPKGTIKGLKFATVKDAEASVNKIKRSGKAHNHKTQAAIAMEQRAESMGKKSAAAVFRKFINQQKEKTAEKNESLVRHVIRELLTEKTIAVGQCYPFAVNMAKDSQVSDRNDLKKFKVVHGRVTDKFSGDSYDHAWVEKGDLVFDDQTKFTKPDGIPRDAYYDLSQPQVSDEYTAAQTIVNCVNTGHAGPWK